VHIIKGEEREREGFRGIGLQQTGQKDFLRTTRSTS